MSIWIHGILTRGFNFCAISLRPPSPSFSLSLILLSAPKRISPYHDNLLNLGRRISFRSFCSPVICSPHWNFVACCGTELLERSRVNKAVNDQEVFLLLSFSLCNMLNVRIFVA